MTPQVCAATRFFVTVHFYPAPDEAIRCLLQSLTAIGQAENVAPPGLLSDEERAQYEAFRVPKRRQDWLLGRWTAKQLVCARLRERGSTPRLDEIIIRANPDGSPYATLTGGRLPLSLSISHSGACSFCALTGHPHATVGADIEMIERRPLSLAEQFFTQEELAALLAAPHDQRDVLMTLVWSAKEAFLKSLKQGLRVDTRRVAVEMPRVAAEVGIWRPLEVAAEGALMPGDATYQAWWRREEGAVLTLGMLLRAV